jgi:hypothetical protein
MHKSATKCNETIGKWCKNKHGASKIIDTFETYQRLWRGRSMAIGARDGARRDDKLELEISSAPVLIVKKDAGESLSLRMGHVHGGTDLGLEAGLTF